MRHLVVATDPDALQLDLDPASLSHIPPSLNLVTSLTLPPLCSGMRAGSYVILFRLSHKLSFCSLTRVAKCFFFSLACKMCQSKRETRSSRIAGSQFVWISKEKGKVSNGEVGVGVCVLLHVKRECCVHDKKLTTLKPFPTQNSC